MKKFFLGGAVVLSVIAGVVGYLVYYFFFSMGHLPEGNLVKQSSSPDKTYTVNLYMVGGGATVSNSIRGELVNNKTHSKENIFWEYKTEKTNVVWLDDHTVIINSHQLDVTKDTYDWRRHK